MRWRAGGGNTIIYFHFAKFPSLFWPSAMPGEKAKRRWEDKWKQLLLFPCASWPALCKHVLATLPSPRGSWEPHRLVWLQGLQSRCLWSSLRTWA